MSQTQLRTTGFRIHSVVKVKMDCPYCDTENIVSADTFDDEELWYGQIVEQECEYCHNYFLVEINDDC